MTISPSTSKDNHRLISAPSACVAVCVAGCVAECVVLSNTKELEQVLVKTVRVLPRSELGRRTTCACCSELQWAAVSCSELQWVAGVPGVARPVHFAVCCSVLQCGAVWCSVVQCGAVWYTCSCCSVLQYMFVMQCVVVYATYSCCSVLQYVAMCCGVWCSVALCCNVLQYVMQCGSVLQYLQMQYVNPTLIHYFRTYSRTNHTTLPHKLSQTLTRAHKLPQTLTNYSHKQIILPQTKTNVHPN